MFLLDFVPHLWELYFFILLSCLAYLNFTEERQIFIWICYKKKPIQYVVVQYSIRVCTSRNWNLIISASQNKGLPGQYAPFGGDIYYKKIIEFITLQRTRLLLYWRVKLGLRHNKYFCENLITFGCLVNLAFLWHRTETKIIFRKSFRENSHLS